MTTATFAIPGDIDLPTGGYAYDRRVLALLPAAGVDVQHLPLPGSFPAPGEADLALTEHLLAATPPHGVLLVDGLALGAMPVAILRRLGRKVVALCHHPLFLEAGLTEARRRALHRSEHDVLADAAHVIVTSPTTARIVAAEFGVAQDRITVAVPGTDPAPRARGSRGPVHLLAVGSIVPRKGYDVLMRALVALETRDWRLTIAGARRDAATVEALERQIAQAGLGGKVHIAGAVEVDSLARLYDEADLFVMPSLFEGYGMVLAEAMARGLAIVCTTGGAAAETVPDTAAFKVPPGDDAALATALHRTIDDAALRRRLAEESWQAGRALPGWDRTAATIAAVLRRVAT